MARDRPIPEPQIPSVAGVPDSAVPTGVLPLDDAGAERLRRIAEAAYKRAEQRNFARGHDLEDWLAAEQEIDALIRDESHR